MSSPSLLQSYELHAPPSGRVGIAEAPRPAAPGRLKLVKSRGAEDCPAITSTDRLRRVALQLVDGAMVIAAITLTALLTPLAIEPTGSVVAVAVVFAFVRVLGLHDKDTLVLRRSTLDEAPRLAEVAALSAGAYWLSLADGPGRLPLLVLVALSTALLVSGRTATRSLFATFAAPERCLFIGDMSVSDAVRDKVGAARTRAAVVAAIPLDDTATAEDFGGVTGLRRLVSQTRATRVIFAPVSVSAADTLELVRVAKEAGVRVSLFPRLFEVVGTAVEYEELEGLVLMGVRRFGLSPSARHLKRGFDVVGAGVAVLACAPLMAMIAVLVRLDSRGPVLFRQTRVGRDGERFEILKFRSMVGGAEAIKGSLTELNETDGLFKLARDPRVTRVGRLLRSTSLDELPQLLNVLRGDMSLVGPRPLVVDEDELVRGLDRRRLHLTPGMTGPWQIMRSGRVPMAEMVGIDYLYVSTWTLWTDVKILLRTVGYVLARGGV